MFLGLSLGEEFEDELEGVGEGDECEQEVVVEIEACESDVDEYFHVRGTE